MSKKIETIDIEDVLNNAAKEAENISVVMQGRAGAFKDMINFFKKNNLKVIKETEEDEPAEPQKATEN